MSIQSEKILIVSDTHGRLENLERVIRKERPETIIHAGDFQGDEDEIRQMAGCDVYMVSGNCDYFTALPASFTVGWGHHKIMVTHGHAYFVSLGTDQLRREAAKRGCDIVIYGHTHRPQIDSSDPGLLVLNPGSLTSPRQAGRVPTYLILSADERGNAKAQLCYV